jgi:hypothetical protein
VQPGNQEDSITGAVIKWTYPPVDFDSSSRPESFIGTQYATYNGNSDANWQGHEWGTFVWQDPSGKLLWEGPFETIAIGRRQAQWSAVAHGTGAADGLQWKGDGTLATGLPYVKLHVVGPPK